MAFDQNSIPKGLRPLNVARNIVEDPRITTVATTGRNPEWFIPNAPRDVVSPDAVPVPLPAKVSDVGFVGVGYGNVVTGIAPWCPRMPPPVAHPAAIPAVGFSYNPNPNMSNHCGANAVDLASNAMAIGISHNPSHRVVGGGMDPESNDISVVPGNNINLGNKFTANGDQSIKDSTSGLGLDSRNSVGGNAADQVSEECGDGSISLKKIKFLCSFGGKILPRSSDEMLRYVGGQTRIISVKRDVSFNEFVQKIVSTCGQPVVIKYQLPDEDLDALVTVSCPDDLDNMMDEYEKLVERSSDGSAKLRLFLFSASELDSSSMMHFGNLHDGGQRFVETVNGTIDGVGGRITRKASFASATSTQNSDFSGAEAVDISNNDLGDMSGPQSTTVFSPRGNLVSPGLVNVHPVSAVHVDDYVIPSGISMASSGPPEALAYSQSETELGRSVPVTLKQKPPGNDFTPPASHLQPSLDPRRPACVDYVQFRPQFGFPNHHLLGSPGSIRIQQPNNPGITHHQFVPAVHMTKAPPSSHPSIRPNITQSFVQHSQSQTEFFVNESTFGPRFVQLSAEQSYNSYQVPSPAVSAGGGFGLHQLPLFDHAVISDGLVSHQQVTFPEKIERLDNCHLCQKALPHAHSDSLVQDQTENVTNLVSDSKVSFHGFQSRDYSTSQPMKNVTASGVLGQLAVEQGAGMKTRIFSPMDPEFGNPPLEAIGFSRGIEVRHEDESLTLKDPGHFDNTKISALQGAIGRPGGIQSPHVAAMDNIPHSCQDDAIQLYQAAVENQVNQNLDLDKHDLHYGGASVTSEYIVHENPKEYFNRHCGIIPNKDATDTGILYDHVRPIVGKLETLSKCPTDICANMEHCKSTIERNWKEDNFDNSLQPVAERQVQLENNIAKPRVVLDTNHLKPSTLACFSSEVPYSPNLQPVECCEPAQPPVKGYPGALPQSKNGIQHLEANEACHDGARNPHLVDMKTDHMNNKIPVSAEWKGDTDLFQSKIVTGDVESLSIPSRTEDAQGAPNSLFSIHDPWKLQHDTHFLPPKPNKIRLRNEAISTTEPLTESHFRNIGELNTEVALDDGVGRQLVNSNKDTSSESVQSAKGSSEEQIRNDLQAVAEGVAASVLQSAKSSNSDLHEKSDTVCEASTERDVLNGNDIRTKQSERVHLGFPLSEGIGRLQIIKNSDLEELRELGSGTFGTVYHGKWRGTDVAIKRINDRCFAGKPSEQDRMREDFWNEAIKLADLHHPNVVAFYGVVLDGPGGSVATVTEYMVNGSLRNALLRNEKTLDKRKRLLIAMDVAFGMEYLHRKNIVHFDLKSDNLLVNLRDPHRPICKVGDLGLSKVKCKTLISGGVRGTLPWMAPELLNGSSNLVSEKVDVFSFGIVLWELLTGEEPYANLHYGAIIGGIVNNTLRPPVPDSCDPEWRSLMERCWSSEPSERPNFTETANELRAMAAKIPPKVPNQQQ